MITRNFKHLLAQVLSSTTLSAARLGNLPIRNVFGMTKYICNQITQFPFNTNLSASLIETSAGISVGTGDTPATEFDYNLENTLTSDSINLMQTQVVPGIDSDNPYVNLHLTIANISNNPITISEIGYKQSFIASDTPLGISASATIVLIDRTVLDVPLILQPDEAGVIEYRLQTNPMGQRYKEGIKLVSWSLGSDEEIVTLINAARQGIIDLQTDAHWSVSDVRIINVNAWTDSSGTEHAANQIAIAISQFGDYNSCGCLFQFDFVGCYGDVQIGVGNNGYGGCELKTITIPSFFNALPSWLQLLSKEFNVLAVKGGTGFPEIETVTGNKLALRSEIEVMGTDIYAPPGEGSAVELYKNSAFRIKAPFLNSNAQGWLLRSLYGTGSSNWVSIDKYGRSSTLTYGTNGAGFSPFGCI